MADFGLFFATAPHLPGDSRETIHLIVQWALDFEFLYRRVTWGITPGKDYMEASEEFFHERYAEWLEGAVDTRENDDARPVRTPHTTRVGDRVHWCHNAKLTKRKRVKFRAMLNPPATVIAVKPGYIIIEPVHKRFYPHCITSWVKVRK